MKKIIIASAFAMLFGVFAMTSCSKTKQEAPTTVTVEVVDITASSATVNVDVTGKEAEMVRFIAPVPAESLNFDITNEAAVAEYLTTGDVIGTPFSTPVTALAPATEYFTGAIAFDANFQPVSSVFATFTTLTPDNAIGEENGAGVIENKRW